MPSYVTITGMKVTFGTRVIDKVFASGSGVVAATGVFNKIATGIEAKVNAEFGVIYTTPFVAGSVPQEIISIVECEVFKYAIRARVGKIPEEFQAMLDMWKDFYDTAKEGELKLTVGTSTNHLCPTETARTGLPTFRRTIFDREGNQVNTDIVPEDEEGTLDTW